MYQHIRYGGLKRSVKSCVGQCVNFGKFTYANSKKKMNNDISSLKSSRRIRMYRGQNCRGQNQTFRRNSSWIGRKNNDKFSSFKFL
eukprot:NODE_2221_length_742_cov_646.626263_g1793_i0.p3 GENE.NODE_2221_length_742_cov_646.626263_g1793_i0~~NODE_2221_length_742_cov_646.626263_g1793_i0.p3  ORF type:complete len:86 (+),score=6.20 NODE_2221_length_742_cov_646.626263_g1793_i0:381-638(+)